MLAYILAIVVGLGSLALFLTAFFRPKLHRQDDFLWSGIGLFYTLVLWLGAQQLRGGLLLGQVAGTALILTFGWQTLKLRWAIANPEAIAEIESFSLLAWLQNRVSSAFKKKQPSPPPITVAPPAAKTPLEVVETPPEVEAEEPAPPQAEVVTSEPSEPPIPEPTSETVVEEAISIPPEGETAQEEITQAATTPEDKPATQSKESFSFKKLFGFGKQKPEPKIPSAKPESITAALDSSEAETESSNKTDEDASIPQTLEPAAVVESTDAIATSEPETETSNQAEIEVGSRDRDEETHIEAHRAEAESPQTKTSEKVKLTEISSEPTVEIVDAGANREEMLPESEREHSTSETSKSVDEENVLGTPNSSSSPSPSSPEENKQ
ncbi:Ycf66 protein [Pleurocapsa sp. PCC 7327]|uniref:Ycf66 family protein n=1 Tax=Pleurocapsa sp. PCC 7327 TaxID=118163 RepID=UPI00029FD799|nr:Ycf66 family protein [Pleurocapsa sp. PCC 7327]AFY76790.1 Ycf66 protein [Pleurocapsa sp. PCC 7327]